jgi:hypothetical protein
MIESVYRVACSTEPFMGGKPEPCLISFLQGPISLIRYLMQDSAHRIERTLARVAGCHYIPDRIDFQAHSRRLPKRVS